MPFSETKNLVYFLWKKIYIRNFCSVKARDFGLKIGTFPRLLVIAGYPCCVGTFWHLLWSSDWHVTSDIWSVAQSVQRYQVKRLAWVYWLTLKQCNSQLVTFLQIRDILIDYRHRASLIFYYSYQYYCFYYYCYSLPFSFQTWSSNTIDRVATCHS